MTHDNDNDLNSPFLGEPTNTEEPGRGSKRRFLALGLALLSFTGITLTAYRFKDRFSSQRQDPQASSLRSQPILGWSMVGEAIYGKASFDQMGYATAVSEDGNILIAGAPFHSKNKGSIRILQKSGGAYVPIGSDFVGKTAGDKLGFSVAVTSDGKFAIAGAPYEDGYKGCVHIYLISGSSAREVGVLSGDNKSDTFGLTVALADTDQSGNRRVRAIVGAPAYSSSSRIGYARVFQYNQDTTQWEKVNGDIQGPAGEQFATSVAMSFNGQNVAIGTPTKNKVAIYKDKSAWTKIGNNIVIDAKKNAMCGADVDVSEKADKLVIGCLVHDTVHSFYYKSGGWVELGKGIQGQIGFGTSISISSKGDRVAIGGPYYNDNENGRCCVFQYVGGNQMNWEKVSTDIVGTEGGDTAGWSVGLSSDGKYVSCGSPKHSSSDMKNNGDVVVWTD